MRRFFVPRAEIRGEEFDFPDSEAHHALSVLRCREGDCVAVLDGCGRELSCEITSANRRAVRVRVRSERRFARPAVPVVLFQSMVKGKAFDLIVEKATEIGVSEIVPVVGERVVAAPSDRQMAGKVDKWRQTAIGAVKQSGRAWLPEIQSPLPFFSAVSRAEKCDWNVVAALDDSARPLREWLRGMSGVLVTGASIGVWIGPEGDFTKSEYEVLRSRKYSFATLTDAVLRAETAALFALACIQYELSHCEK